MIIIFVCIQVPLPKWRDNTNRATVRFDNNTTNNKRRKKKKFIRKRKKKLTDIVPHKAKELSAVMQYRRQEKLHNEQLLDMLMKEQKREKSRQRNILNAATEEEREKLKALYKHQRQNAQKRIEYVDKDRKMLLEKHYKELILGLEAERRIKIKANKPFLELAKLELLEIVRKARLTTGAKVTVDKAFNRTLNMLKARVFLRKKAKFAVEKNDARLTLKKYVQKARIKIWEKCIRRLFDIGYSCTRILDDTEYHLQIHPSKAGWYQGMLEVVAIDTFLGAPLGLIKVQIPMPLQLLLYLKQELPLQNVVLDYHRCLNTLYTVCHRLRFGRVLESDDPRKQRLEDPTTRIKGFTGLKARGIFRTKKSMKKMPKKRAKDQACNCKRFKNIPAGMGLES